MVIVLRDVSEPRGWSLGHRGTYTKVSSAVVVPARRRVHKPSGVQLSNPLGQLKLGVVFCDLAPGFVVDDLDSG